MSITNSSNFLNSSSILYSIFIAICLSLIALITALGNIVVLLAFYCDNKLRTINDYFILNMAIADFLVGCFCIPFYIPFSITQSWPFGRLFCKIWVTIDDVATMASVINIVAISINRYWSIAYPISYRKYVKQRLVYLVMASVWCLSFINFAPGIWLLNLFDKQILIQNETHHDCSGDYHHSFAYMLIAQFNYFIWPFILLCILNILIMINIWKRTRKMSRLMSFSQSTKVKEETLVPTSLGTSKDTEDDQNLSILSKNKMSLIERCPSTIIEENSNILRRFSSNKTLSNLFDNNKTESSNKSQYTITYSSSFINNKSQHITNSFAKKHNFQNILRSSPMINFSRQRVSINQYVSRHYRNESITEYQIENEHENENENQYEDELTQINLNENVSSNKSKVKCQQYRQSRSRIIRDRKAARSLFILVIVFLIFLFPYVICATASTAGINVSTIIFEISFWLLWMNSACNPFLYPFIQIKYRRAYVKLFQSSMKYLTFSRSNNYL